MMLRSQTIALTVLFVALGLIFILVGSGDLNTDVFSAQPTASGTPLPEPTAIAVAGRWTEQVPGQLVYALDPAAQAVIVYEAMAPATFAQQQTIELPAGDEPYPLLEMLGQIRTSLEQQADAQSIVIEDGALIGPYIEAVGGVPVAFFRAQVAPQTVPGGGQFPGLDREWALVERAGDDVMMVLYGLQGEPQAAIYADYRAWLEENIGELAAADEDAAAETEPDTAEPGDEAAPEEEFDADGGEDAAESDDDAALDSEAEAEADADLEATDEALAEPVEEVAAAEAGPWAEMLPGQLRHADSPNTFLFYNVGPVDEFAAQVGIEALDEDDPDPLQTILDFMQRQIETQLSDSGLTFGPDAFEGPETQVFGGVPVAFMRIVIEAQTAGDGQPVEGQELAIALIDRGDGTVGVVEFVHSGPPSPQLDADLRAWLEENAPRLADTSAELPEFDTQTEAEGAIGEEAGD